MHSPATESLSHGQSVTAPCETQSQLSAQTHARAPPLSGATLGHSNGNKRRREPADAAGLLANDHEHADPTESVNPADSAPLVKQAAVMEPSDNISANMILNDSQESISVEDVDVVDDGSGVLPTGYHAFQAQK